MGIMEACLQFPMTGSPGTCMVAQMVLKQGNLYPDLQAEKEAGEGETDWVWLGPLKLQSLPTTSDTPLPKRSHLLQQWQTS